MYPIWMLVSAAAAVAAPPTLTSLNYAQADIAGGGQSIVATGTNCSAVTQVNIWGTTVTPSATTATTVTFTAPAHAAGTTTVSLTNPGGTSGTLAFESWSPVQITGLDFYIDANKGVTGGAAVSAWTDQGPNAVAFAQGTTANKPVQTANVFGALPSIRCTPQQFVQAAARTYSTAVSLFVVGKWTSTRAVQTDSHNVPLAAISYGLGAYLSLGANAGKAEAQGFDGGGPHFFDSTTTTLNDGNPHLFGMSWNAANALKIYNGAATETTTTNPYNGASTQIDTVGSGYTGIDGWNGDIAAAIALTTVITAGDLTKLNKWSQQRWGSA